MGVDMAEQPMLEHAEAELGQLLESRYYRQDPVDRDTILGEVALEYATPRNSSYTWEDSRIFLRGKGFIVDYLGEDDFKIRGDDLEVFYNSIDTENGAWAASVNYWDDVPSLPLKERDNTLLTHLHQEFKRGKTAVYTAPGA